MEKSLIYFLIFAALFIIVLVLFLTFSSMGSKKKVVKKVQKKGTTSYRDKKVTIKEMVEIAANRNSSRSDLINAILKVAKELPFPKKSRGVAPKEAELYLEFVLLIASHKNADAKLIAFCNKELKKANPTYATEIEIYENEGLKQKANRI